MNRFLRKKVIVRVGLASAVIIAAIINFSLADSSNKDTHATYNLTDLVKIADANAENCPAEAKPMCGSDGTGCTVVANQIPYSYQNCNPKGS